MPISYHRDVSAASRTEARSDCLCDLRGSTAGLSRATPRRECRLPPPRRGEGGVSCHREISPNPKADRRDLSKGGDQFRRLMMSGVSGRLPLRVNRVGLLRLLALPLKTNDRTSSIGADDVRAGFDRWRCSALAAVLNAIGFAI